MCYSYEALNPFSHYLQVGKRLMPPSGGSGKRDLIPDTDSTLILPPMDGSRIKWARQMDPPMVRFKKLPRSQLYYH